VQSLELRVPSPDDAAGIAALLNEHSRALTDRDDVTVEDVEHWFREPGLDPERDMRIAFTPNGALAGYADLGGGEADGEPVWIDLRMRPGHDGVGPRLLEAMEGAAGLRGAPPRHLRVWLHSADRAGRDLLIARGYDTVRSGYRMEIGLAADLAPPQWPDGLTVQPLGQGEERRAFEAYLDSFEDSPDFFATPYDQWAFWLLDEDDPALAFLAEDGGDVAGLWIGRERRGGDLDLGWIHVIGVRPPWRRRGLGRALLLHALGQLRTRGKPRAGLGVDAANDRALRLYETEGMRIVRRTDVYEKAP
jgi:mycothiol synthase